MQTLEIGLPVNPKLHELNNHGVICKTPRLVACTYSTRLAVWLALSNQPSYQDSCFLLRTVWISQKWTLLMFLRDQMTSSQKNEDDKSSDILLKYTLTSNLKMWYSVWSVEHCTDDRPHIERHHSKNHFYLDSKDSKLIYLQTKLYITSL